MFQRGERISQDLTVQFHIKTGLNADTYRVRNDGGSLFFLKTFHRDRMEPDEFTSDGLVREVEMLRALNHPAITRFADSGVLEADAGTKDFLLTTFISGESIQDRLRRELTIDPAEARRYLIRLLEGLDYLHGQPDPISHNEVTNQNVMLDLSGNAPESVLIDFGHARYNFEGPWRPKPGHDPYYLAPESFLGEGGPAADVFAAGALYYHMLFGIPPWYLNISQYQAQRSDIHAALAKERNSKLKFPQVQSTLTIEENDLKALHRALSLSTSVRYATAAEFLAALKTKEPSHREGGSKSDPKGPETTAPRRPARKLKRGFDAVAGMEDMKQLLLRDVIKALKERDGYESYGIPIPNGLLLYGPPGCGKTFIAERFAEEAGLNFRYVKPSDIASIYVHGTQEKIGELFKDARENAPTVLFFDELDAMMPNRDNNLGHSYASEVNEFLVQMGNCSKDGVFIIAATNRPDLIDPAVLRAGRMDKVVYLPPPDMEARRAMFQLHLEERPVSPDIDHVALAAETDGRVASDLEFLVNEAARIAYSVRLPIGQAHLIQAIKENRPSLSAAELEKYIEMKKRLESGGAVNHRNQIGFSAIPKNRQND